MVGNLNCSQLKIQWVTGNMNSLGEKSRTQEIAWKVCCTLFFKNYFVCILEFCTMIWWEQKPEKPQLQHYRLQMSGQNCQGPLNLGAERKARKSSGQLQAPRKPLQEPACAGKGTHGANSHISPVENGAGAAKARLRIPSSLPFPHLFWLHLAQGTRVMSPARWGPLEVTAGVTSPAQHSQLGTWGHGEPSPPPTPAAVPSQPSWAVPGNTAETFQRDQVPQGDRDTSIPWESIPHSYLQPGES